MNIDRPVFLGAVPGDATLPDLSEVFASAVAALDLETALGGPDLPSSTRAGDLVEALSALEPQDPGSHGPQLGLMLAVTAGWRLGTDRAAEAGAVAEAAVGKLLRFADQPRRIQAALLFALLVKARVAASDGRADDARAAEQRARVLAAAMGLAETAPTVDSSAGTDDPIAHAEALIDEAIALGKQERHTASTEILNGVIGTLTSLRDESATPPAGLDRTLFRATWRLSLALLAGSTAVAAVRAGRQALTLGRSLLAGQGADEQVTAAVVVTATDVAEMSFAAGLTGEGLDLLREAERWSRNGTGPELARARGTVLHNWTAAGLRILAGPDAPENTQEILKDIAGSILEAIGLRRGLRDPSDGVSLYELANSLRLLAQICVAVGNTARAADSLAEAYGEIESLSAGHAVNQLKAQLAATVRILERIAPTEVARERAMGRIPG